MIAGATTTPIGFPGREPPAASSTWDHGLHGLRVVSDLELPAPLLEAGEPQVRFEVGAVAMTGAESRFGDHAFEGGPGWFRFQLDRVLKAEVRDGSRVVVEPHPEATETMVRCALLGLPIRVLLLQRGIAQLHGNAVVRPGGALVLAGFPGAGKSTASLAALRAGFDLVADDLCAFDHGADGLRVLPGARQLKLWPDVAALLDRDPARTARVAPKADKVCRVLPRARDPRPRRVLAFVEIVSRPEGGSGGDLVPLEGPIRLALVHAHGPSPRVLAVTRTELEHRRRCLHLAAAVPAFRMHRPTGKVDLESVGRLLDRLHRDLTGGDVDE